MDRGGRTDAPQRHAGNQLTETESGPDRQPVGYGRDFRLYATGQAISVVGDRIALIALVFLVIRLSRSYAPALGLFYVCRVLPTLVAGLVAGVVADHFDRRRLMMGCDIGRALLLSVVPTATSLGLWTIYPIVAVLYGLSLLFHAAATAALPDVVPEAKLTGANAILRSIGAAGDLAYVLGGGLVYVLKLQLPFYIDAATFVFSGLMIFGMRVPQMRRGPLPNAREVISRVQGGIEYVMGNPFLKWSTLTFAIAPIGGGAVFVIAPLYAQHSLEHSTGLVGPLHSGAFRFSVLEVALGVGALGGSALAANLARRWPRGWLFGAGIAGVGVSYAVLSLIANIYGAACVMIIAGAFSSLFFVSGQTLLQALTPSEVRGRVAAVRETVIDTALALGSAAGSAALLLVSYPAMWLVLGGLMAVASLFVWLRPEVRNQV